jgi:hypothetical protein
MSSAGIYNLTIEQGDTLSLTFTYYDGSNNLVDLTSYTARSQGRLEYSSSSSVFDLTTENGGITLGGVNGTITLSMTAAATAALSIAKGVWDLELISGAGVVDKLLRGRFEIQPEVTK